MVYEVTATGVGDFFYEVARVVDPILPDLAQRPDRFDGPLHKLVGHGHHVVGPLSTPYCLLRRHADQLTDAQRASLKDATLAQLSEDEQYTFTQAFAGSLVVFLPGLINYSPSNNFFNLMAAVFENGGLVLSMAQKHSTISERGLFTMVGGDVRALQPDWRGEVALVFRRLGSMLMDTSRPFFKSERLVFLGHSKGGLLVHALAALNRHYDHERNDGTFRLFLYEVFPGLLEVPHLCISRVMSYLKNADFHMLASPVEGLPSTSFLKMMDTLFLNTAVAHFSPDFMARHFNALCFGPEIVNSHFTCERPASVRQAIAGDEGARGLLQRTASQATRALFYGAGHLVGATHGDSIVPSLRGRHPNEVRLAGRYDHLDSIEKPQAAREMLRRMAHVAMANRAAHLKVGVSVPTRTMLSMARR